MLKAHHERAQIRPLPFMPGCLPCPAPARLPVLARNHVVAVAAPSPPLAMTRTFGTMFVAFGGTS